MSKPVETPAIDDILDDPHQRKDDEKRVVDPENAEQGWQEVTDRAAQEAAGEAAQRETGFSPLRTDSAAQST